MFKGDDNLITLVGKSLYNVKQFRGLSSDVTANKHLPNAHGVMECTNHKLKNGDELYCMDNGDTYLYDEENMVWIKQ